MPKASTKDDEVKDSAGTPDVDAEVVGDDDEGFVEVTEDGTPVQDRNVTSDTDEGDEPDTDDDDEAGTETDRAKLEQKRKKAAQRENAKLKRQLAAMEQKLAQLEQGYGSIREAEIERLRGTVQERVSAAEQALEAAYEDGDAKGIVAAQRALHKAEAEAERWQREASNGAKQTRPASAPAATNPLVEQFLEKHDDWFNPAGGDVESDIVIRLSSEIAREGIAPTSKKHFDELERRMARHLPDRVSASKPKPRASAAAPSTGRASSGGEGQGRIPIPKATIAGFKELGVDWDDPDPEARKAARAKITARVTEARRNRQGDAA